MNRGRIRRLLTAVVLGALCFAGPKLSSAETKGKGIERPAIGQKLRSPDGLFSASFEETGEYYSSYPLRVTDRKTSKSQVIDIPTTSSALYWTGDSKTLIAVILLSGGPIPMVYHLNEVGSWEGDEVIPPGEHNKKLCLIACQPKEHSVLLTYSTIRWSQPGVNIKYYEQVWDYDPSTRFVNDETVKQVSKIQFDKHLRKYFLD